jgi:signal transduction histidine kinase
MPEKTDPSADRFRHVIFRTVALALSHDVKKPIAHIGEYMSLLRNHLKRYSNRVDIDVDASYLNSKIAKYTKSSGEATKSLQHWADQIKAADFSNMIATGTFRDLETNIEKKIIDLGKDISEFTAKAKEIARDDPTSLDLIKTIERNHSRMTDQYHGLKELLIAVEEPQFEQTDLLELIDSQVTNYRRLFGLFEIEVSALDNRPTIVYAMRGQILAVIQNLLENAIRFARRSKEYNLAVTLNTAPFSALKKKYEKPLQTLDGSGSWVELHVRNKGTRISEESAEDIFVLFVTTEHKGKPQTECDGLLGGGSGIGLTVSRAYVTAHSGVIFLNTDNSIWTDFVVLLPTNPRFGLPLEPLLAKFYSHITDS